MKTSTETKIIGDRAFRGRGKEAFENARRFMSAVRGRPRKGEEAIGTSTRTLRLPNNVWQELEALATQHEMSLHMLVRAIIGQALYTEDSKPSSRGKRVRVRERPTPANDSASKARRTRRTG
jgi:predicted DNA-binding ribbon-helix-helix protein